MIPIRTQLGVPAGVQLNHRLVLVFRALMMTGNVTRTAEVLHTSQPTVSRELGRLEQVLGFPLFDRVSGRLRPTVRAKLLLQEVERSYVGLERIAAAALALRQFEAGRLTVACLPAFASTILPPSIRAFADAHPQAGVEVVPTESPALESLLTEQRADLGLIEGRDAPNGTTMTTLLEVDEVAVLPDGHPLLKRRVLRPQDFAGQSFVSLAAGDPYRMLLDEALGEVDRVMRFEAGSAAAVCAMVRQGLGIGVVNPLTAAGMETRPLSFSIPFHVGLVVPDLRPPSPLLDPFIESLTSTARTLLP